MSTITVTNLDDTGNGSLRQAIANANPGDTINFAANLAGGTLTLTSGELDINSNVTIEGDIDRNGTPDITISGGGNSRVFEVGNGSTADFDGLVIKGGNAAAGGGLLVDTGTNATVTDSTFGGNSATLGGAIASYGDTTLANTTLSGNTASFQGGALYVGFDSIATVTGGTLADNNAGLGGAIHNYGALTLADTTLSGNVAGDGGAIFSNPGAGATSVVAINTTISGNYSGTEGGGIDSASPLSLIDSTVSGNRAGISGGGVYTGHALTLTNSIVAGNAASNTGNDVGNGGTLTAVGNNILGSAPSRGTFDTTNGSYTTIDGSNAGALGTVFAHVGIDPHTRVLSGVLADNGGGVETIALNRTGIAIDAGSNAALPADTLDLNHNGNIAESLPVDARGEPRVVGASVDIGAFEAQATPTNLVVTTLDDETYDGGDIVAETADGNGLSLREALGLANAAGGSHTITFDPSLAGGTLTLTNGELDIASNVTIDGDIDGDGTPDIAIDGGGNSRVFEVNIGLTADLDGLVITGGNATYGGGLYAQGANVTVTDSTLSGNSASMDGGAIESIGGTLTLANTTLSGNEAGRSGGAIAGFHGIITAINTTVSGNSAVLDGGGIEGRLTDVYLISSTVSGNKAAGGSGYGGGLSIGRGPLTLNNSIVAGNAAATSGDDVSESGGTLATVGNNIVGSAPVGGTFNTTNGSYTTIDGTSAAALGTVFAHVGNDPHTGVLSGVLAYNGGGVATIALNPTGIAVNTGVSAALPADTLDLNHNGNTAEPLPVDARGFSRTVGSSVDIGAFEQQTPQNLVVTTLNDELDSTNPNATIADMGGPNDLSLREALFLANEDPTTADTITFANDLSGGTIDLTLGQLKLTGGVTIDGGDNHITVDAQGYSRAIDALYGTSTINGLTITGGYAGIGGAVKVGSSSGYSGADLTISNSTITNNQAAYGGGIAVNYGSSLQLTNSVVSGNNAYLVGGGIANQGTLTLTNSTVTGNSSGYLGGGIASDNTLTIIGSTLSDNQTGGFGPGLPPGYHYGGGGGLYNSGGATLLNTTISGNNGGSGGGGIYNSEALTLINVTLANNSADTGGGLSNAACGCGNVTIDDSTITGNAATMYGGGIANAGGNLTLANSIVAGNGAAMQGPDIAGSSYATIIYSGVNLFSQSGIGRPGTDIYVSPSDLAQVFASLTTIDPDGVPNSGDEFLAGTLANNGGPVETVLIKLNGAANNAGDNTALPVDPNNPDQLLPVDARGEVRVFDGTVDLGAIELQVLATPVVMAVAPNVNAGASENFTPAQLFSASTPLGDPIVSYEVEDESTGPDNGFWVLNGGVLPNGQITTLSAAQLSELSFVAGSDSTPVVDTLDVAASNAGGPGAFATFTVTAAAHGPSAPPVVTAANELQAPGLTLAASNMFSATASGGNSIASYEVEDTTAGSGHWMLNGVSEPTNQLVYLTTAQLSQLNFVTGGGSDILMVRANDGSQWGNFTTFSVMPPNPPPPAGTTADMITVRGSDGAYEIYDLGNNSVLAAHPLTLISAPWHVVGLGGFNGTDTTDMMLRNGSTGAFQIDDVSNNNVTGIAMLGAVGLDQAVAGFGDFSGNVGENDMMLRNSNSGQFEVYDISNNAVTGFHALGAVGLDWSIAGFADLSGNANETDMLLRNSSTGQFTVYDINNNAVTATHSLGAVGLDWSTVGFGDFSGKAGENDMLMRNANTGQFEIYDIANNAVTGAHMIGAVGLDWTVVGFGNLSGNPNETDMMMHNSNSGQFEIYDITNNQVTGTHSIGPAGLEWSAVGIAKDPPTSNAPSSAAPAALDDVQGPFTASAAGSWLTQMVQTSPSDTAGWLAPAMQAGGAANQTSPAGTVFGSSNAGPGPGFDASNGLVAGTIPPTVFAMPNPLQTHTG